MHRLQLVDVSGVVAGDDLQASLEFVPLPHGVIQCLLQLVYPTAIGVSPLGRQIRGNVDVAVRLMAGGRRMAHGGGPSHRRDAVEQLAVHGREFGGDRLPIPQVL